MAVNTIQEVPKILMQIKIPSKEKLRYLPVAVTVNKLIITFLKPIKYLSKRMLRSYNIRQILKQYNLAKTKSYQIQKMEMEYKN